MFVERFKREITTRRLGHKVHGRDSGTQERVNSRTFVGSPRILRQSVGKTREAKPLCAMSIPWSAQQRLRSASVSNDDLPGGQYRSGCQKGRIMAYVYQYHGMEKAMTLTCASVRLYCADRIHWAAAAAAKKKESSANANRSALIRTMCSGRGSQSLGVCSTIFR